MHFFWAQEFIKALSTKRQIWKKKNIWKRQPQPSAPINTETFLVWMPGQFSNTATKDTKTANKDRKKINGNILKKMASHLQKKKKRLNYTLWRWYLALYQLWHSKLLPQKAVSAVCVFVDVLIMCTDMPKSNIIINCWHVNIRTTCPIATHSVKPSSITDLWSALDCSLYFVSTTACLTMQCE